MWPAEKKWVNPEFVRVGTSLTLAELLHVNFHKSIFIYKNFFIYTKTEWSNLHQ